MLGVTAHTCSPSVQEAETRGPQTWGQLALLSKTPFQNLLWGWTQE